MKKEFFHPRYWPTWIGLGLVRLLSILPLPLLAAMGSGIGLMTWWLFGSRRRITLKNLQACFPDWPADKTERMAKDCFELIGQSLLYTGIGWWASPEQLDRMITISGRKYYDQALAENNNIILLAPHFCALEFAGLILSRERPCITMYQHTKNRLVDEFVKRGRGRFGGVLVERKEPMRNLIRLTRKGYPFYYLPDQDARQRGVFAPFYSIQTSTFPMLGRFAAMTKAVVIPCSTRILPHGQGFEVCLGAPLENFPSGDDLADTAAMNRAIEKMIDPMPEQYFWVHKRFKTRPEGEPAFYD